MILIGRLILGGKLVRWAESRSYRHRHASSAIHGRGREMTSLDRDDPPARVLAHRHSCAVKGHPTPLQRVSSSQNFDQLVVQSHKAKAEAFDTT
jgi:hypothetical protein